MVTTAAAQKPFSTDDHTPGPTHHALQDHPLIDSYYVLTFIVRGNSTTTGTHMIQHSTVGVVRRAE
jgi:hypothetical protein